MDEVSFQMRLGRLHSCMYVCRELGNARRERMKRSGLIGERGGGVGEIICARFQRCTALPYTGRGSTSLPLLFCCDVT